MRQFPNPWSTPVSRPSEHARADVCSDFERQERTVDNKNLQPKGTQENIMSASRSFDQRLSRYLAASMDSLDDAIRSLFDFLKHHRKVDSDNSQTKDGQSSEKPDR